MMRTALASIVVFVLFLLLLELLFRLVVFSVKGTQEDRFLVVPDQELGWVLNTRMRSKRHENRCGETVELTAAPHPLIIKFPNAPGHGKILFIGDSYTHAHEVSTGKAYYDIFERLGDGRFEVYAAAVGGYGSLQEFLMLQRVYDEIEPDLVIWQLTGNDISNNVFELDDHSINNNQRPRPYLDPTDGSVRVRNPGFWFFDWSEGFAFFFQRLLAVDTKYGLGIIDFLDRAPLEQGTRRRLEEQGLEVLNVLVKRAVAAWPQTDFIGFSVDSKYDQRFERIFTENGARYLSRFFEAVNAIRGTNCKPLDFHWNHRGNVVAGTELNKRLANLAPPR